MQSYHNKVWLYITYQIWQFVALPFIFLDLPIVVSSCERHDKIDCVIFTFVKTFLIFILILYWP